MRTFNSFLRDKFNSGKNWHHYSGFKRWKVNYYRMEGFTEWLENSRGATPSLGMVNSIARTFVQDGSRMPYEIPAILTDLERQYQIKVPVISGILSREYWIEKAESMKFKVKQ